METTCIDGKRYAQLLLGGLASLCAHIEELNALNVFPVADGDTGTNMSKTLEGGLSTAKAEAGDSIGAYSKLLAKGILLSARGNSGVILSQIFAGINEGLEKLDTVTATQLAAAYKSGIARSYEAVQNPTEGTILTVFRESTEYAASHMGADASLEEFFRLHLEEARRSLKATKELLPALKQADVVDSGAAGYLYIAEGMYDTLLGKEVTYAAPVSAEKETINIDAFTRDSVLEFGYCTEFLLRLTTAKVDPDTFDIKTVLAVLEELGGESVVAYKQDDIVKVHVHSFTPGAILARMQDFGEFLTVKVENMSLGHSETQKPQPKIQKPFAVVAVASGEGMSALFTDLGVDCIVEGGQTANPSTEDFIAAFEQCESESILVLPNNKNILLAAKQAATMYTRARVCVVETKNMVQGYCALSVITPGITDMDVLVQSAQRAAEGVIDGEVTKAVRDAAFGELKIHAGDYMAISSGEIVAVADTAEQAVLSMLENADTDLCEIITLFVGKQVTDDARAALTEQLKEAYEDCEIVVYMGDQDVYDYYIAVE